MGDGEAGKLVDPKAAPVERGVGGGVTGERPCGDVVGGEGAGREGVVDALAGEGLDDAGGIAGEEDAIVQGSDGGASEGGDGAPLDGGREAETAGYGVAEGGQAGGCGDEAEVGEIAANGSDPAVAAGEEVELDLVGKGGGRGDVGLEADAVAA